MTQLIVILFAVTYVGMALGRVPGLRVDRAGIAMIAAVVLVAVGAVPTGELTSAIHFPTLLLLGGLMILSARVGASGFYDAASVWIAGQAGRPLRLLAAHHRRRRRALGIAGQRHRGVRDDAAAVRRPHRAQPRSAAVPVRARRRQQRRFGAKPDRQSAEHPDRPGRQYRLLAVFADAAVPALVGLVISFGCIALMWRSSLAAPATDAPLEPVAFDRVQVGTCGIALARCWCCLPRRCRARYRRCWSPPA